MWELVGEETSHPDCTLARCKGSESKATKCRQTSIEVVGIGRMTAPQKRRANPARIFLYTDQGESDMKPAKVLFTAALLAFAAASYAGKGEFGDLCATGLTMGKEVKTDCSINQKIDGKTYCFSGEEPKAMFMKDPKANLAKAQQNFDKMMKK
jgi:YHS domain-containing protein